MTTMPPISPRTRRALRLRQTTPARSGPGARPSAPAWLGLLRQLAPLGEVWIETRLPGLGVSQMVTLHGPRTQDEVARIAARGYELRLFLDHWCDVREIRPTMALAPHRLAIGGRAGETLATFWSDAPICPLLLRSAVRAFHDAGQPPTPPAGTRVGGGERPRPPDDDTASADAQLRGYARQRPTPTPELREIALDRLPAWLDAVLRQSLPVRLQAGTAGLVQCCDAVVRADPETRDGWLRLAGQRVRLELDRRRLGSAWIHTRPAGAGQRRQLRLYASDGRALLFVEGAPRFGETEDPRWRTLLNTLLD